MRIAITGATGWVGRSANAAISQLINLGHNLEVENYSSRPCAITLIDGIQYRTKSYEQFDQSSFDLFIPLGFPTQEKYHILGEEKYKSDIDSLIQRDESALLNNPSAKVLLISSGVVNELSESQSANPGYSFYAKMKSAQEARLQNIVGVHNLNVCYLYSCTSRDIQDFDSYAFSSILKKAMKNEDIAISNSLPVVRKYVDLRELCSAMLLEILEGENLRISSGGHKVEIEELANLVVEVTNSSSAITRNNSNSNSKSDVYFAEDESFEMIFRKRNLEYSGLNAQIENMMAAISTGA
jgi:nucleoside-diphosphate-sugar epimerase